MSEEQIIGSPGAAEQPVSTLLGVDWVPHDGGVCPVSADAVIQPWFRIDDLFGAEANEPSPARSYRWSHVRGSGLSGWGDIVAYRLPDGPKGQDGIDQPPLDEHPSPPDATAPSEGGAET